VLIILLGWVSVVTHAMASLKMHFSLFPGDSRRPHHRRSAPDRLCAEPAFDSSFIFRISHRNLVLARPPNRLSVADGSHAGCSFAALHSLHPRLFPYWL